MALVLWQQAVEPRPPRAHVDVATGAWTQADAGVGRGIDSFYEYMLKASTCCSRGDEYLAVFHAAARAPHSQAAQARLVVRRRAP